MGSRDLIASAYLRSLIDSRRQRYLSVTAPSAVRQVRPPGPRPRMALPPADAGALRAVKYCSLFVAFVSVWSAQWRTFLDGVTYLPQCGNRDADYSPL
jgi:hypothetical protein